MACNIPSHGEGSEAIELTYFGEMESAELTLVNLVLWQLAAVVKFVVTPSAMVAAGHSFLAAWGITSMGSSFGVAFFWHFGKWVQRSIERRRSQHEAPPKKVFTPRRRRIVRLKNALGMPGLLCLSGLISVPLASVIGAKYFRDTPGAMVLLMSAFVVWAAVLTFVSWGIKHSIL